MAENKFKVGDKVIFHPELCEKSFYGEAAYYTKMGGLKANTVYTIAGLANNGSGELNFVTIKDLDNWNHPYDVFTPYSEEFVLRHPVG